MKVLKFGAVWCNGCLVMRPRWQKIEDDMPELETEYFDFDKDKKEVEKYEIDQGRLPCFVFLNNGGEEMERVWGEVAEARLRELIEKYSEE